MFFNTNQHRVRNDIVNSIELYGVPEIQVVGDSLGFSVGGLGLVQSLFALDEETTPPPLAAVAIYARPSEEKLVLLHLGVGADYAAGARKADKLPELHLVNELRRIARTVKGITQLELLYGGAPRKIPVR